jgi:hypothetical protein
MGVKPAKSGFRGAILVFSKKSWGSAEISREIWLQRKLKKTTIFRSQFRIWIKNNDF